jgi:hypothetical protein
MSDLAGVGVGWEDLIISPVEGDAVSALAYENYRDTSFKMKFFNHTQDDVLYFSYQMSHGLDVNTMVMPHIHVVPMSDGAGNVVFSGEYVWVMDGSIIPASSGWTSYKIVYALTAADRYVFKQIDFALIEPPSNVTLSSILLIKVTRPGSSDGDDTYTTNKDHGTPQANIGVLSTDLHYRAIKVGSLNIVGAP